MNQTIAIANQKGGVAKTTSTINLAYALAQRDQRVLMVDMDPQGSLTVYCGHEPHELEKQRQTVYWGLTNGEHKKELADLIIANTIDLLPASLQLAKADLEFVHEWDSVSILRDKLKPLGDRYDFILIDCPPTLTLLTVNALVAADSVLIPAETSFLALMGIPLLLEIIEDVRSKPNPHLAIIGILPTKHVPQYNQNREALEELRALAEPNIRVFEPINRSTQYDKSAAEAQPTLAYDPKAPGVENYHKLADYILSYE